MAQARYVEAEKTLREAIESGARVYGLENSFFLAFTSNLAFALAGQGQYAESEKVRRPLILLQKKGKHHPVLSLFFFRFFFEHRS
jgi:hypothetical protein